MNVFKKNILLITIMSIIAITVPVYATNCGIIQRHKIQTYGGLSCHKAKEVFIGFQRGAIPTGWNCGQSVGGCGFGEKGFYFLPVKKSKRIK
jgi:hypothetical protein